MMVSPCEQITQKIGELFICSSVNQYIRIETPFLYPDGDVIDIFYKAEGDDILLTDFGETLGWLQMQTVSQRQSTKQRQLINDICLTHGINLDHGMLIVRLKQSDDLSEAVIRLSQAALRVSDIWFTFKGQSSQSIVDEVEDLFQTHQISYQRNPEIPGRSNTLWKPDFRTMQLEHKSLIYVLSTGSSSAAKRIVAQTSAAWHDLSYLVSGPEALKFISLFDDTFDVWKEEDFRLVEDTSDVTFWSQPDEFLEKIAS